MLPAELSAYHYLTTPVWVVDPDDERVVFANHAAQALAGDSSLTSLRFGALSACAQTRLAHYINDLKHQHEIVEIWTFATPSGELPLRCRLSLATFPTMPPVILFEGANIPHAATESPARSAGYPSRRHSFYHRFFTTTTAPMLLIDPTRDGRIVDANLAALRFYGYGREEMCQLHTWEINTLGRQVLPVMAEIARLPGGHKPLYFVHRMADGSTRHVLTYAGPIIIGSDRLMLCIIHDITEQKRLEQELEHAALRDSLTGLLNRRQFYALTEGPASRHLLLKNDYCLLLVDTDNFKAINDNFGHLKGDEVLVQLSRILETCSRAGDFIFRWGGEEFVLMLPHTPLESAVELAERIRDSVTKLNHEGLPGFTVSVGVARHQAGETIDEIFKRVDKALYQAKNDGRNKVLAA
ncbi:sensor domain-containing diguanylate cyclase [Enterobacter sp. CC120223-11]|uniref:GGDEF domain-containing protein n=1 Tax=Enterobacter sp. CC120223-11 TaxID=1378073 RepID=UPI000BDC4ADA|nr:sensor domain-containing diguanylate cyclase [Enterobacter sp. CC120223-11]SNY59178.1 PAS domain S-box-containing protein/diguanylate cyclase (GGDEF) domain-containing protein [Enterobacter sp. CC120223-11]